MNQLHNCKKHPGERLTVGPHTVWAGGISLSPRCINQVDVIVTLADRPALAYNEDSFPDVQVHSLELPDFGGVTEDWAERVQKVAQLLEEGKRIAVHCHGGFGRTGVLLASLIATLETREEAPDPIKAVRERYCPYAVETWEQAVGCFALRGQVPPPRYLALRRAKG